jgi:hypothetical protein
MLVRQGGSGLHARESGGSVDGAAVGAFGLSCGGVMQDNSQPADED